MCWVFFDLRYNIYNLEGMMLKLKLQYSGHLMRRVDSLEKTLMLGGIGSRRRRGRQRMRWLDGITDSMDLSWVNSGSCWWTGRPGVLQFMESQRVGHDWVTELNWTGKISEDMANTILWFFTSKTYFHFEGYGVIIIFYESSFFPPNSH